uniref:Sec-independent protein translocase n=1 Tax=Sirodotia delicatula TaxID=386631 RepID=A0A343UY40_9FLOR|nr:Sec-independent protein translocase [Sirodotia delicatula]AVK39597.1 Sec-independent protein translocase [Sirodotia delicatula]
MRPALIYFKEFLWRFFYCLLSLVVVFFVALYHAELLLLFEVYPFIKFTHKKFIATHVTELFDSVMQTCFFMTFIANFPFIVYHILAFFSVCWYSYQIILFKLYTFLMSHVFITSSILTNIYLLPQIFNFFIQWEMVQDNSLLQLEMDTRIYSYLTWVNYIYSLVNFLFSFFLTNLFLLVLFVSPYKVYICLKYYRKQFIFTIIASFMFILPPDFWIQLTLFTCVSIFLEFSFLLSCFRLNQLIMFNCWHKTR